LGKNDVRLFKLTRIKNFVVTEEEFSERNLLKVYIEQNEPSERNYKAVTLMLKITSEMTYRIYDDFNEEQIIKNDDGSFTVTMTEPEDNWLYGYILSFGEYIEILEPEHIKDIVKEKARKIFNKYF